MTKRMIDADEFKKAVDNKEKEMLGQVGLSKVPTEVNKIIFVLRSFSGENFDQVAGEFVQIKDVAVGRIIAKTVEPVTGSSKSLVFGSLIRSNNEWSFETTFEYKAQNFSEYVLSVTQ